MIGKAGWRSQKREICARERLERLMVVTKERVLCPQTLGKADGGHKREGFVTANTKIKITGSKKGSWNPPPAKKRHDVAKKGSWNPLPAKKRHDCR
jgi:hypothetical protein